MKVRKAFRLSPQAIQHLDQLRERTGASETALVEMALAYLHRALFEVRPAPEPNLASSRTTASQSGRNPKKRRKKRKRR